MRFRTFGRAIVAGMSLLLLTSGLALADNVKNDVVAGGNDTFTAGGSTTIRYWIQPTGGTCDAADGSSAAVSINVPSGVTATPSSLVFNSCNTESEGNPNNTKSVVFSSSTAGDYSITVAVVDSAGSYNPSPANFTLHVLAPPPPSDTTPPSISYVLNPAAPDGSNGWYKSDVTLTWTVTENESPGSLIKTGCLDQSITADQLETAYSCSASSDGGTAGPVSVSIKRDATAPTITDFSHSPSSPHGSNDWYVSEVTETFHASDATSGLADCATSFTKGSGATEGSSVKINSGSCSDNAGNTAAAIDSAAYKIDLSDPYAITWTGGPAADESYYFGFVPSAPTCSATDDISGFASCDVTGYSAAVGSHTMTATATDNAGRTNTAQRAYSVSAWTLTGFYSPVDMSGILNTVKGGSTVPLKFEVFAGDTELTSTAVVKSFTTAKVACNELAGALTDEIEVTSTGQTVLRYDSTSGQFIQNWQTPKTPGLCYKATMKTQDDTSITAYFKTK